MISKINNGAKNDQELSLALIGCGGLAVEVSDYLMESGAKGYSADQLLLKYVISDNFDRIEDINSIFRSSATCLRKLSEISEIDDLLFVICVGDPSRRYEIFKELKSINGELVTVIHRTASVSASAQIGEGSIIAPYCVVSPFSVVGKNCVLNTKSTLGHDSIVGDNVVLSPHSVINGGVNCGAVTLVSAGCVVDPNLKIGSFCKLASGAVVKNDVPDGFLVIGNPARGRKMFKIG